MSFILSSLEGVVCMVDYILVSGSTQEQHDQRLEKILDKISQAGVTLNADKCVFSQPSVRFLGQVVDAAGINPDPEQVRAVQAMKEPTYISELRQFLDKFAQSVNYLQ